MNNFWSGKTWALARVNLISWRKRRWRRCLSWSCGRRTTLLSGKRRRRQKSGSRWLKVAGKIVFKREMVFMHEIHQVDLYCLSDTNNTDATWRITVQIEWLLKTKTKDEKKKTFWWWFKLDLCTLTCNCYTKRRRSGNTCHNDINRIEFSLVFFCGTVQ